MGRRQHPAIAEINRGRRTTNSDIGKARIIEGAVVFCVPSPPATIVSATRISRGSKHNRRSERPPPPDDFRRRTGRDECSGNSQSRSMMPDSSRFTRAVGMRPNPGPEVERANRQFQETAWRTAWDRLSGNDRAIIHHLTNSSLFAVRRAVNRRRKRTKEGAQND